MTEELKNPIVDKQDILKYIPQRPPIVLISRIYSCDETAIISGFDITPEHIFAQNGFLNESGLVENMAQTAAAMAGYSAVSKNQTPAVGFIGNIKDLVIHALPPEGQEIYTEVITKTQVMNVSIIQAKVYNQDFVFAECEMKIFLQENA
jgi:predicted hotdog family 3-hydroxylacyl-ACP dehydratase